MLPKLCLGFMLVLLANPTLAALPTTPLRRAIALCDVEKVTAMVNSGIDVNVPDKTGFSPFSYLVVQTTSPRDPQSNQHANCMKILDYFLKHGADIHKQAHLDKDNTVISNALLLSTINSQYEAFALLLTSATSINDPVNKAGETLLINAVLYRDPKIVELLLKHGADPTIGNIFNKTPLDIARGPEEPSRMRTLAVMGITRTQEDTDRIIELLEQAL